MYSFDVMIEGKNTCRQLDTMMHNKGCTFNTPPTPELQPPNTAVVVPDDDPRPFKIVKVESKPVKEGDPHR
jgi:hypothetical protein